MTSKDKLNKVGAGHVWTLIVMFLFSYIISPILKMPINIYLLAVSLALSLFVGTLISTLITRTSCWELLETDRTLHGAMLAFISYPMLVRMGLHFFPGKLTHLPKCEEAWFWAAGSLGLVIPAWMLLRIVWVFLCSITFFIIDVEKLLISLVAPRITPPTDEASPE